MYEEHPEYREKKEKENSEYLIFIYLKRKSSKK